MIERDAHCSRCGTLFPQSTPPMSGVTLSPHRVCGNCGATSYRNPVPVAAVLVPVGSGLLTVRRRIEPKRGMLTFPGGFVNYGESWQQAAAREFHEETGFRLIEPEGIRVFDILSTSRGHLVLLFGLTDPLDPASIERLTRFVPTEETSELVVYTGQEELAFEHDTLVAQKYFSMRAERKP